MSRFPREAPPDERNILPKSSAVSQCDVELTVMVGGLLTGVWVTLQCFSDLHSCIVESSPSLEPVTSQIWGSI